MEPPSINLPIKPKSHDLLSYLSELQAESNQKFNKASLLWVKKLLQTTNKNNPRRVFLQLVGPQVCSRLGGARATVLQAVQRKVGRGFQEATAEMQPRRPPGRSRQSSGRPRWKQSAQQLVPNSPRPVRYHQQEPLVTELDSCIPQHVHYNMDWVQRDKLSVILLKHLVVVIMNIKKTR